MPASENYTPLDTLKRYLDYRPLGNDPWTGLMKGQQDLPLSGAKPRDETVLYRTASPLVNITEGDIGRATEVGLAASGGGLKGQQIKAYHSSPHDFDKFDLSKIGSGEGAQVYGHGLYFAENPAVSGQGGQYWDQFKSRFTGPESTAATELKLSKFDRELAQRNLSEEINKLIDRGESPGVIANRTKALQLLESGQPVGPRTYEVNINADPAHMLDWDKPLREQAAGARLPPEMIDQAKREAYNRALGATSKSRADELWGMVKDPLQAPGGFMIDASKKFRGPETSAALEKVGIPGIKYLDQGSRGAGTGSSNYVIFNPSILDIVKKYGLAGLASAPALTSGLRDRESQP